MDLSKTHILVGGLTDTVYIASGQQEGERFTASSKVDRTSEFIAALLEWCGAGNERNIQLPDGKIIVVSMREQDAEA